MARQPAKPRRWRGRLVSRGGGLWMLGVAVCAAAALAVNTAVGATAAATTATGTAGSASTPPANTGTARELPASSADQATLLHVYLKARDLPAGTAASAGHGSLRVAVTKDGEEWALASFAPARRLKAPLLVRFQDGAATGIFRRVPGQPWQFVQAGVEPVGCDTAVPAAVRAAWHVTANISCGAGPSSSPRAAARARAGLDATSSLAANIASTALGQVGVSDIPTVTNFDTVDCDPYTPMVGPLYPDPDTRGCGYNAKFGVENENEQWCSDFAEWVWLHAGVTQDMDLINPGSNSFYAWGQAQGESLPADGTDPRVGDAVVLYPPGQITASTGASHVGIVTAVNANGTLNIVNGDFLGTSNISVQYDTDVSIGPWAAEVEGTPGEQWVFVSPPATAQPASPVAQISGPAVAAAGTAVTFQASASQPGGSIASEAWAFGNGEYEPNGAATGSAVQHVFADPGQQTVSMIATSNLGTITVKTLTVDVVAGSSALASTASDALYYAYTPVAQTLFVDRASGGLAEESWDGASWLDENRPGSVAVGSPVAALQYKDSGGVLEPHVFARSAAGSLIEVAPAGGAWSAVTLPGSVAPASAIAATTIAPGPASEPAYPAVFTYDPAGRLTETYSTGGSWKNGVLPAPASSPGAVAAATSFQSGVPVPQIYSISRQDALVVTSQLAGQWSSSVVPSPFKIAPASSLAAVSSPVDGSGAAVFFTDQAGHVAEASQDATGSGWTVRQISSTAVAAGGTLLATNFVPSTGSPQPDVFAVGTSGHPLLISSSGGAWTTQVLPGTATSLLALGDYAVPGSPQSVFFRSAHGIEEDSNPSGSGAWTLSGPLPDTPVTFAGRVILYAATKADLATATQAAASAGLPSSAVTGSFATAWDHGLSGSYLVLTVGLAGTDALYYNVCGWTNPSDAFPGSTPFFLVTPPVDQLPGADNIEEAAGSTATQTADLAYDLAYYALHGKLPAGVTSLPTEASPQFTCSGEPSV
jgi:PKD domain/CHAP domain